MLKLTYITTHIAPGYWLQPGRRCRWLRRAKDRSLALGRYITGCKIYSGKLHVTLEQRVWLHSTLRTVCTSRRWIRMAKGTNGSHSYADYNDNFPPDMTGLCSLIISTFSCNRRFGLLVCLPRRHGLAVACCALACWTRWSTFDCEATWMLSCIPICVNHLPQHRPHRDSPVSLRTHNNCFWCRILKTGKKMSILCFIGEWVIFIEYL